ncbi:ComF family protein [Loktanella salsilacus]|uniref:ComF family protein n=1 Tax=Loktanella salsilacus TaxID=195913 RepID=UPI0020B6AF01|nr:ComF family protein [Loktanella salsilacus]UTH48085.1 ComF family protein [Loktanella salsilacus]
MQSVIRAIYPSQCVACDTQTAEDHGLCGACWRDTQFIHGLICDACGTPLMGQGAGPVHCDDCMTILRPWDQGRAALVYEGIGRRMVLNLKHGDRTDLAVPAAKWMLHAGRQIIRPDMVVVPVPLHWTRLISRRYNQAALLSRLVARGLGAPHVPDALRRVKRTTKMETVGRDARFAALAGAIAHHPARAHLIAGRDVLLVDDVMTSGATFAAATESLQAAGAQRVCILALARVVKDT